MRKAEAALFATDVVFGTVHLGLKATAKAIDYLADQTAKAEGSLVERITGGNIPGCSKQDVYLERTETTEDRIARIQAQFRRKSTLKAV